MARTTAGRTRSRVDPQCPIRPGDPCSLCQQGATGPEDCALVHLVLRDPELRERLAELRRETLGPRRP